MSEKFFTIWEVVIGIIVLSFFVALMVVTREEEAYKQGQVDAINGIIKVEPRTSKKLSANWDFKNGEEYE